MASSEDIPRWEANSAQSCARIEMVRSPLKIVLKTKNDPFFIERWITHHINIVGPENLIIFDNMSDDPEVFSTYRKYRDRIHIIQFAGPHNNLHHIPSYKKLYQSLAKSSKYVLFTAAPGASYVTCRGRTGGNYSGTKEEGGKIMTSTRLLPIAIFIVAIAVLFSLGTIWEHAKVIIATGEVSPREWIQIIVTFVILAACLFVILSKRFAQTDRHWAYGTIGTLIGFWLKM